MATAKFDLIYLIFFGGVGPKWKSVDDKQEHVNWNAKFETFRRVFLDFLRKRIV